MAVLDASQRGFGNPERLCKLSRRDLVGSAVRPNAFVRFHDTYRIGLGRGLSILPVSHAPAGPFYDARMVGDWKTWGRRFKELAKENGHTLVSLSEQMELTDAALRHWTNGTREINLSTFFRLCELAQVDPAQVLFGAPIMSTEIRQGLSDLAKSVLEADPAASPSYHKLGNRLRRAPKVKA